MNIQTNICKTPQNSGKLRMKGNQVVNASKRMNTFSITAKINLLLN